MTSRTSLPLAGDDEDGSSSTTSQEFTDLGTSQIDLGNDNKGPSAAPAYDSGEPMPLDAEKRLALGRWILAVAIVNFDLDVGPVVERLYPDVLMTPNVRENM
ncbi:hypothetical protein FRB90_000921 [Tulasnella sp. 427]|nr:hypothetical protein FRB90_000921 [Tulasnella sp. 427]